MKSFLAISVLATLTIKTAPAHADFPHWGTVEQARTCIPEYLDTVDPDYGTNAWGGNVYRDQPLINKAIQDGKVSAACKAEIDAFEKGCTTDKYEESMKKKYAKGDPAGWCQQRAFLAIRDLLTNDPEQKRVAKEKADAAAKAKALEEAAKVELPKADKKDPGLEKQIAAAYKAAYPDNAVLLVLLQAKQWSTERDNWGTITNRNYQAIVVNKHPDGTCELHNEMWMQEYIGGRFKGALMQRGAGSQRLTPILCEKVPGASKATKGTK